MPDSVNDLNSTDKRLPRWQFRKNKKLEKRRTKRKELAEKKPPSEIQHHEPTVQESEQYKTDKQHWEERERQFRLIEVAKKRALEKAAEAKKLAQKRWQDTLLNLPLAPPSFSTHLNKDTAKPSKTTTAPFKKFITSSETVSTSRKTYRERYLEKKRSKKQS